MGQNNEEKMHVYRTDYGVTEWWIARDIHDLFAVIIKHYGEHFIEDTMGTGFTIAKLPPTKKIKIDGKVRTVRYWLQVGIRGLLCSTEL